MTSRRPMTRSYSGNGRSSSQNGEDVSAPSGRSESRNYLSNVRPENRSTLCTVMAQLTEETQPCFETTIKSKAVSETCNVKFSCVVTGYPAPELTWYKDDMELDRYCGLPKYEIFRNGKIHTLHVYNCTEDDAAIYQASARNSKGIVSCSGVLEVGTMSEYMIHQRFFAKLKQKAESKRRELEESRRRGKENIQKEQLNAINQERLLRKRRIPAGTDLQNLSPTTQDEDGHVPSDGVHEERPVIIDDMSEGSVRATIPSSTETGHHNHVEETSIQQPHEKPDEKKMRIANGFNEESVNHATQSDGEQDDPDDGIALAKYLAESVQQNLSPEQSQEKMEVDGSDAQNKAVETERKRSREEERDRTRVKEKGRERVKEKEKPAQVEQEPKSVSSKSSPHKDQEHHHKSALSSVLHSLKDIFFGKSKKATETADSSRKTSQSSLDKEIQLELPSTNHPEEADFETLTTTVVVEQDVPQHPKGSVELDLKSLQQTASSTTRTEIPSSTEFTASKHEDVSPRAELHLETNGTSPPTLEPQESTELPQKPESESRANDLLQTSPSPNVEIENDNVEPSSSEADCQTPTETLESTHAPADEVIQGAEEIYVLEEKGGSEAHLTDISMADLESMPCCESQPESQLSQQEPHTIAILNGSQTVEPVEDENKEGSNSKEKVISLTEEERIAKPQEGDSPTKGIEEKVKDREEEEKVVENELERESSLPVVVDQKPIIRISPPPVIQKIHERAIDDAMEVDLKAEDRSIAELDVSAKENKDITASAINQNNMDGNVIHGKVLCIEQKDRVEDVVESRNEKTRHDVKEEKISEEQSDVPNVPKVSESKKPTEEAILNVEIEASKSVKKTEIEVLEVIQRPYKVDKAKPLAKGQVERRLADKDQPPVQPIIILPDTRETVIKNVAKKRSTPLIPEIKVTFPDRQKREETIPLPRGDFLKLEPERLVQPQDKLINDAPRALGELIVNNAPVISEILGVLRGNQAAEERPQDVKAESMEARLQGGEEQGRNSNGRGREEDSTIPTINIACADDNLITGMSSLPGIVISEDVTQPAVPPITVTMDNGISAGKNESEMVGSEKPKELTPQLGTDLPLPLLTLTPQSPTPDPEKIPQAKDTKAESEASTDRLLRDKPSIEKLGLTAPVGPTLPPLSPASLRRLMAKNNPNLDNQGSVPGAPMDGSEKKGDESGGSTPTSTLSCESSPKMKRRDSLTLIPSATPEELASGARRKIYLAKTKSEDEGSDTQGKRDSPYMSPSQARRAAFLQLQSGQQTPPSERRSPLMARRKATLEVPKPKEESLEVMESTKPESKPAEKEKLDPFKAPQVIRKIRGEPFSDASGHLKLWCQFFNVLSESIIKWYRDEEEILEFKKCAGDESPVALAIVQASSGDCGVYGCSIKNEYGTDITDYLLSADILAEFFLREDLEVGEEIEMTPMMFTKGLADSGYWGEKFFGRIMTEEVQIGEGCGHKTCRAKVIYGLDPVYESGSTCITKVRNPIAYGAKEESNLSERNLQITRQDCKIQNTVREYCKIFAAEARVIENFGFSLEVIPLHLVYRPANTVPYATVETDLKGSFLKYCLTDNTGKMINRSTSEVEQKCCTFQHWIHQWTNGNLLVTRIEGVDTKMTSIEIASKSSGYQGLTEKASPKIMEQFITQHQCNYYCGLLGLRPLKPVDPQQPKIKTSRSPLLARRGMSGSSSPQLQKKGTSPQSGRKGPASPKVVKKPSEAGQSTPTTKHKAVEVPKPVRMR